MASLESVMTSHEPGSVGIRAGVLPVAGFAGKGAGAPGNGFNAPRFVSGKSSHEPTHPHPLRGGEHNSGRATRVPLLGGVRGGFPAARRDSGILRLASPAA